MATASLERNLNDFDPRVRRAALEALAERQGAGQAVSPPEGDAFNLHCHTFFSFNAYGYSPSGLAWLAKQKGYRALGIVDFDTLDGVEEFLSACELLGVRGSAGIETRVYLPEFSTREINSPGEPGVCYHMGIGFTGSAPPGPAGQILAGLRRRSEQRNREMAARINQALGPVSVDYERDVLPLTPAGNATERHILAAYLRAAETVPDPVAFWAGALGQSGEQIRALLADPVKFSNFIRSKLMKKGGVGYIQPDPNSFPTLGEFHTLITACGALPCLAWLDGTSRGEQDIRELLDLMLSKGVVAVNIIPDRNWNVADPEQRRVKAANLYAFVQLAQELDLPINVGTEMNSPGNRLVDDFAAPEMAPLYPAFWEGACFIYGHTLLQRARGLGYLSDWAQERFPTRRERNAFYTRVGELAPREEPLAAAFLDGDHPSPQAILNGLEKKV
ncbi:MAG TPA: hypothetical protein VMT46_00785 [Anaerolineaceae bacterium]|nr:hypothetical protein [Anaerolineaceae bacterium]